MKDYLNILEWQTNLKLQPWAVPQVKALILEAAVTLQPQGTGGEARPSFFSGYPLLQFQARRHRGQDHLFLLGLTPATQHWIEQLDGLVLDAPGHPTTLRILHTQRRAFRLRPAEDEYTYHLFNYTPLRTQEYRYYRAMPTTEERAFYLAALLGRHMQTYYQHALDRSPEFDITGLTVLREKPIRTQGCPLHGFDLQFTTTAFLPEYLGLGPGAGRGLGMVRRPRRAA
jgi:hypothetical protein